MLRSCEKYENARTTCKVCSIGSASRRDSSSPFTAAASDASFGSESVRRKRTAVWRMCSMPSRVASPTCSAITSPSSRPSRRRSSRSSCSFSSRGSVAGASMVGRLYCRQPIREEPVFKIFRNPLLSAATGLFLWLSAAPAWAQSADPNEFRVTLLGTGSPAPSLKRFGPSVLVQAGSKNLLFDCGRGVTQRLPQAGVRLGALDAVLLTHLHSDHTVGIPDLWLTGWLPLPVASRKGPFRIYGPAGTKAMMDNLAKAFDWDVRTRIADQK